MTARHQGPDPRMQNPLSQFAPAWLPDPVSASIAVLRAKAVRRRLARGLFACVCLLATGVGVAAPAAPAQQPASTSTVELSIDGVIGPATADHVRRGLASAAAGGAQLVVLRIDTPGGLDTSMRRIVQSIVASTVPVVAWVAPNGARAASAGTYIVYASHVAAMAPATTIGAATPVALGGGGLPGMGGPKDGDADRDRNTDNDNDRDRGVGTDTGTDRRGKRAAPAPRNASEAKAVNDAASYLRTLAELRGRNVDFAERAVREAATMTATVARDQHVVDLLAGDVDELLRQLNGRKVKVPGGTVTLSTDHVELHSIEPDWRTRLLGVISDPNVALLLVVIGFYGLLFELVSPGTAVPGTIGAISLVLGLYALSQLPLDIAGVVLGVLGLALLVAEAFTPSFGVLGIGGVVALTFGASMLFDTAGIPGFELDWKTLASIGVCALVLAAIVARMALLAMRRPAVTGREGLIGAIGEVLEWRDGRGHIHVRGERWQATGPANLALAERVRVSGIEGLVLQVRPFSSTDEARSHQSGLRSHRSGPPTPDIRSKP